MTLYIRLWKESDKGRERREKLSRLLSVFKNSTKIKMLESKKPSQSIKKLQSNEVELKVNFLDDTIHTFNLKVSMNPSCLLSVSNRKSIFESMCKLEEKKNSNCISLFMILICILQKRCSGTEFLHQVFDYLNLAERKYFGIQIVRHQQHEEFVVSV